MIRKPQRKSYRVEYWFCGDTSCKKHVSEAIAMRCIQTQQRLAKRPHTNHWNDELYMQAAELRTAGKTLREIGEAFNVSAWRASQVLAKWDRLQRYRVRLAANPVEATSLAPRSSTPRMP